MRDVDRSEMVADLVEKGWTGPRNTDPRLATDAELEEGFLAELEIEGAMIALNHYPELAQLTAEVTTEWGDQRRALVRELVLLGFLWGHMHADNGGDL